MNDIERLNNSSDDEIELVCWAILLQKGWNLWLKDRRIKRDSSFRKNVVIVTHEIYRQLKLTKTKEESDKYCLKVLNASYFEEAGIMNIKELKIKSKKFNQVMKILDSIIRKHCERLNIKNKETMDYIEMGIQIVF